MKHEFKYELGLKVKDQITGFTGILVARCNHITGCDTYGIKAKINKGELPKECLFVDEDVIELVNKGIKISNDNPDKGGPHREHPKM